MSLKDILIPKVYYSLPKDNITDEVFIPALKLSTSLDVMTGYFSSGAISELSTGLSHFLNNTNGKVRIVTCPQILEQDQIAIDKGSKNAPEVLAEVFSEYIDDFHSKTALEKHSLKCMSYLIAEKRLELKLAYMKDPHSLFHKKINILSNGEDSLVIAGSTNFTPRGFRKNDEQARIERSWATTEEQITVRQIIDEFESSWEKDKTDSYVLCEAPEAIKNDIVSRYQTTDRPTIQNYDELINEIKNKNLLKTLEEENAEFHIPENIEYETGDYEHQGKAINAWINSNYKGIIQMCTGAGKTITSLICAIKLKEIQKNLVVVIAVPKEPLLHQWAEDVKSFSGSPFLIRGTPEKKLALVHEAFRKISRNTSNIESIICTHDFLCDPNFQKQIKKEDTDILLIADEVHNLGVDSFFNNIPKMMKFRLGLSATPIRQYDPSGTDRLLSYFGDICFEYNLEDAIGICLVHYDYHVHPVSLNAEEMDRYLELSEKIKSFAWAFDEEIENTNLDMLLRERRLLLEQAKNKVPRFKEIFSSNENRDLKHTLVFLSSKQHDQIDEINHYLLHDYGILIHQITGVETQSGTSKKLINDFKIGDIQVLTSMKVLDEGLNVPEIKTAYILASTTVEREWTQRRGRVLRKCDEINKNKAVIHDFMVIVPNDELFNNLIRSEKERITEFAKLSNNPWSEQGGLKILNEYYEA